MVRKRQPTPAAGPPSPVTLHPDTIFTRWQDVARTLNLRSRCVREAIRDGQLRVSRRGGRYLIRWGWVLEWVGDGERRQRRARRKGAA